MTVTGVLLAFQKYWLYLNVLMSACYTGGDFSSSMNVIIIHAATCIGARYEAYSMRLCTCVLLAE